jgi:hypothetical protein
MYNILHLKFINNLSLIFIFNLFSIIYSAENNSSLLNNATSLKPDDYAINVGQRNTSISVTRFFPPCAEITIWVIAVLVIMDLTFEALILLRL